MEQKKEMSLLLKVAAISAITAILVFFVMGAIMAIVYWSICCEPVVKTGEAPAGDGIADRIERAGRTLTGSSTDAAKITSVSFSAWSHAGPLYPGPKDPPGHVFTKLVEFRRDLTASRESSKDYDRDLPTETEKFSGPLTGEQFEKLALICQENDIVNEPDSTKRRSEGSTTLVIEYNGEKKTIQTSNIGIDTPRMKSVLAAIEDLERSISWTKIQ
jgi:hypothetical protein